MLVSFLYCYSANSKVCRWNIVSLETPLQSIAETNSRLLTLDAMIQYRPSLKSRLIIIVTGYSIYPLLEYIIVQLRSTCNREGYWFLFW